MADRIAIVTGTSSGIGAAVARQLLDNDWEVIGIARRPAVLKHDHYRHVMLDLADVQAASNTIDAELGPILDGREWQRVALVNNAANAGDPRPIEHLPARSVQELYAVNVAMPTWLMGFALRHTRNDAALRIVNVSSGAAVHPFPGLGAYGSSKAALRMASMIFGEELASPERLTPAPADAGVCCYEPGVVDTEMQTGARSHSPKDFPWVGTFKDFKRNGMLVRANVPAAEIVQFLESDHAPRYSERRLGG